MKYNCIFQIAPEPTDACELAASWFMQRAEHLAKCKNFISIALSGGKTPRALYQRLSQNSLLPWSKIHLFFVDERDVDRSHPDCNATMCLDSGLIDRLDPSYIHYMRKGPLHEASAKDYEKDLLKHSPLGEFDIILLGMGADGHTASLFPGTHAAAFHDPTSLVVSHQVPSLHGTWRISLTYEALLRAKHVLFYVLGKDKALTLYHLFHDANCQLPAAKVLQLRANAGKETMWIVDKAAYEALGKKT